MPSFHYEISQPSGAMASGVLQAPSLSEAAERLRASGAAILDLREEQSAASTPRRGFHNRVGPRDVAGFTAQLAVMIRAGISLRAALDGIGEQAENAHFRRILRAMKSDVEAGKPFSEALARFPEAFSPLYVSMVRASEMSGGFTRMLDRIAEHLNQQMETRNMVIGAMTYPAVIAIIALSTTIFLLTFVLPRFVTIFAGHEAALPASTHMLLALSSFLAKNWIALLLTIGIGTWMAVVAGGTERGREAIDRAKLAVPLLSKMFRALYISRALHTMGQLVNAGVPILDTLAITAEVSGNVLFLRMWRSVHDAVEGGKKIAVPLGQATLLPRAVVQMISAGEESGRLGEVLDEVSAFYSRELKAVIKSVTSLVEPAMILLMGGMVGFIAASIILPIFKLSQIMAK